jgi:hypothetical protein
MKGGTKIIAFVTICIILLSISFSGCFEEDKEKDDDDKQYLGIEIIDVKLVNISKNIELINFIITINNHQWNTSYSDLENNPFYIEIYENSNFSFSIAGDYSPNNLYLIGNKNNIDGYANYYDRKLKIILKNSDPLNITVQINPKSYTGNSYLINTNGIDGSMEIDVKIVRSPN